MSITLVQANAEDAKLLKYMSIASFKQGYDLYGRYPPGIESLAWHESEIADGHYYKVLSGSDVVGGICVMPLGSNKVFLKYLFISLDTQNKGVGAKVLELIEAQYDWAEQWSLLTPYKSYRNHYFYEKYGYEKAGELQPDPEDEFKAFEYIKTIHR